MGVAFGAASVACAAAAGAAAVGAAATVGAAVGAGVAELPHAASANTTTTNNKLTAKRFMTLLNCFVITHSTRRLATADKQDNRFFAINSLTLRKAGIGMPALRKVSY
jgi:hypothetical protein